jgi:hypothetical protein
MGLATASVDLVLAINKVDSRSISDRDWAFHWGALRQVSKEHSDCAGDLASESCWRSLKGGSAGDIACLLVLQANTLAHIHSVWDILRCWALDRSANRHLPGEVAAVDTNFALELCGDTLESGDALNIAHVTIILPNTIRDISTKCWHRRLAFDWNTGR